MAFPLINPMYQFFDNSGEPLSGGLLYTYAPGTTTNKTTYTDENLSVANANPIVLDSAGRCGIFLTDGEEYKFVLKTSAGVTLDTKDEIKSPSALTAAAVGAVLFARTAAEIAAGVTPTDYTKQPGDFLRYGASAGGSASTNATAINNCFLSNSDCFCTVAGTYQCSSILLVQSNNTIRLAQGVILQASVKTWSSAFVHINAVSNVRWHGGIIDGNKANNAAGIVFGILIRDAIDVKIFGVTSKNCPSNNTTLGAGGDGFYIGGDADPGSVDISLIGCHGEDNVRQGLSIVRGERITIQGGSYEGTTGNNPGGGIDLEGNGTTDNLRDITITGVTINSCYYGIIFTNSASNITCTGCTISDCTFTHVYFGDCNRVTMTGCTIKAGTIAVASPIIDCVSSTNVVFTGNYIKGKATALEGAGFRLLSSTSNFLIANNTFETTYVQGVAVGNSAITVAGPTLIRIIGNTFYNCVDPASTAGVAVMNISGNSGAAIYPLFVEFINNTIYDDRAGANVADVGINVSTSIPAATQANYRLTENRVYGPALVFTASTYMPMTGGVTWNPGNLVDGAGETSPSITVTGAAVGDNVEVYPPYAITDCVCTGYVSAADTCVIRLQNESGSAAFDGASGTWNVRVRKLSQA